MLGLVVVAALWRPGLMPGHVVWGLAAMLPLAVALSGAFFSQSQARAFLSSQGRSEYHVMVDQTSWTLSAVDAACVERAARLGNVGTLKTAVGLIALTENARVGGQLPPAQLSDALSVLGQLQCYFAPAKHS